MTDPKTDPRIFDAFQLMWGTFPEPMILVHRDRTIIAQNDAAVAQGWGGIGQKCFSLNPGANGHTCQGCQANAALKQGASLTCEGDFNGKRIRGYWIPLKDSTEVYIHGYTTVGAALAVVA